MFLMIEKSWDRKISPSLYISSWLSVSDVVKLFDFKENSFQEKSISDIWGWFSPFLPYLKNRYDAWVSTVLDPILKDLSIEQYYDYIDQAISSLRRHVTTTKKELIDNLKQENPNLYKEKEFEVFSSQEISDEYFRYWVTDEITLNWSSALDIQWIDIDSQDKVFMRYFFRHFSDEKKIIILKNLYKILKSDWKLYDLWHKNYWIIRENWGIPVKYYKHAYWVSLTKQELKDLIDKITQDFT